MEPSFKFFSNPSCKYFPCHTMQNSEEFNCLFCFCPLYSLENKCGGTFDYTDKGIKNCMNCKFPHKPDNYDVIVSKLSE